MVLKEMIFNSFYVVVLKEVIVNILYSWEGVMVLKELIFNILYSGMVWWS